MRSLKKSRSWCPGRFCRKRIKSFFGRLRRTEVGVHHHIAAPYLHAYAVEIAWREDNLHVAIGSQAAMVARAAMVASIAEVGGALAAGGISR